MLVHPQRHHRGSPHRRPRKRRDFQVCWVNVGRNSPNHITALQLAFERKIDVVCVQEPSTFAGSRTSTHPAYNHYSPVNSWDHEDDSTRPRVITYVLKSRMLKVEQREQIGSRDLLWIDVERYTILNVYRQPRTPEVLEYITHLSPPPNCLIGGDFNARHDMFEPGSSNENGGAALARWACTNGVEYIGEPGQATHRAGHVLDLSFSNIAFARTVIVEDMNCGSDHETLVTSIPCNSMRTETRGHLTVPTSALERYKNLVGVGMIACSDPGTASNEDELERVITYVTAVLTDAAQVAGKPAREEGHSAPWWTDECRQAHTMHVRARRSQGSSEFKLEAEHNLKATVRKAKAAFWQHIVLSRKAPSAPVRTRAT